MAIGKAGASILLIDSDAIWRGLEQAILTDSGYDVTLLPPDEDPVSFAARTRPRVIVLHLGADQPYQVDVVDRFQANPITRAIPIVVTTVREATAGQAQAGANVSEGVVAPYDIDALEGAVTTALGNPPPAAILPDSVGPVSPSVAFVADQLVLHSREIVLRVVESLRQVEPYRSRFTEVSTGLVDGLGTILGAIAIGLQRGLAPSQVFGEPAVQSTLDEHVRVRTSQGLDLATVIREDQILNSEVERFVNGLIGQEGVDADSVQEVVRRSHAFISQLSRGLVVKYQADHRS